MWFIAFLICASADLLCSAQQGIDLNSPVSADVDQSVQGVNWDSNRYPIKLSSRDGRSSVQNKPPDQVLEDQPLFYSREWQPFVMPINFNHFGESSSPQVESEYPVDHRLLPTFLRIPDTDSNNNSSPSERDEIRPTQAPFSTIMLYPNPFNLYPNGNGLASPNTSAPQMSHSDTTSATAEEKQNEITPFDGLTFPEFSGRSLPFDLYRPLPGFTQPRARVYLNPYPVFPLAREDSPLPSMAGPDFITESGSDVNENNPVMQDTSGERPTTSDVVPPETIQDESSTNSIVPPPMPIPLPAGMYPFGVMPPPMPFAPFSPLIPGSLPPSDQALTPSEERPPVVTALPARFNPIPFLRFTNFRAEIPAPGDAILPPPVVAAAPLDPTNDLPPSEDGLDLPSGDEVIFPKVPYEFGFDMNDGLGTDQHRKEVSDGTGVVTGSYGYRDLFGVYRLVNYIADKDGFRAVVKSNEPGIATSRSANVLVMAEPPPPHALAEGIRVAAEPEVVLTAADEPVELTVAASETVVARESK